MKIIFNKAEQDTVHIDEITEEYLVVAIIDSKPYILGKGYYQHSDELCFFSLKTLFTKGNGIGYSKESDTIQKMIKRAIEKDSKVEAFHQDNWKEALQWLINNAE